MPINQRIILGALAVLLASLTGLQLLLATHTWDPLWSPYRPSPEQVLGMMIQKSKEVDTFHLVQNISARGSTNDMRLDATVGTEGDIDQSNFEELKSNSTFAVDLNFDAQGETQKFGLDGKSITIGDAAYFQITSLSLPEEIQTYLLLLGGIDTNQFLNRWIRFDQEEILRLSGVEQDAIAQELNKQSVLQKDLQELLLSPAFYAVQLELPDENIGGQKMYHYVFEIKIAEMIDAIFTKVFEQEELATGEAFAAEIAKGAVKGAIETMLQKIGPITSDIWIDKKTLLPHKGTIEKTIDLQVLDPALEGTVSFQYELIYSEFHKLLRITAPVQSVPLQELLAPIFESLQQPVLQPDRILPPA